MRKLKCYWFISFIQVGRNRTHPIFQKLHHTKICTSSLYEFAILHSQTSWIMQAALSEHVNYKIVTAFCINSRMSSIASDLYEGILKPNKTHTNCIIQIAPCNRLKSVIIVIQDTIWLFVFKDTIKPYFCERHIVF